MAPYPAHLAGSLSFTFTEKPYLKQQPVIAALRRLKQEDYTVEGWPGLYSVLDRVSIILIITP